LILFHNIFFLLFKFWHSGQDMEYTANTYVVGSKLSPIANEHGVFHGLFVLGGNMPMYICKMTPTNIFRGMLVRQRYFENGFVINYTLCISSAVFKL
jgi:hypothetical protein